MNGSSVLRAACATVANCSASRKPCAAISIFAPRFSTGLRRAWSAGSVAGLDATAIRSSVAFASDSRTITADRAFFEIDGRFTGSGGVSAGAGAADTMGSLCGCGARRS